MLSFAADPLCPPPPPPPPPPIFDDETRPSLKVSFQNQHDHLQQQHHQLPTFSIRDYVFTARNKHIEKSWPFSHHHLQLCSKHEIKHLLPPFEPPDSVRKQCLRKRRQLVPHIHSNKAIVEVASLGVQIYSGQAATSLSQELEQERLTLQRGLSRLPGSDHAVELPVIDDTHSERESAPSNEGLPCLLQEDSSTLSTSPVDLHNTQLQFASQNNETTFEQSARKCKLILKLGPISDPTHTEDITSNTNTTTDSMAAKVCPVCKTFSSTSNTTLNAHIDQCLAVESTSKWVTKDTKLAKHIIKPVKKRSMVDIYATAKPCTLEELDRRNGSNWATTLSLLTTEAKATANEKRQRLSGADFEGTSDECPVYFDSNGTKLRIISNFSGATLSTEGDGPRKLIKNGKESKIVSLNEKKNFRPRNAKCRKPKLRNKKLCSLESNDIEISRAQEMKHRMEKGCHKEESLSQLLKARGGINCSESGTLRQWVCSKRTALLKRVRGKDNHRGVGVSSSMTMNPLFERDKMNFGDYSLGDSNPSENAVSSIRNTNADSPCYESQVTDCGIDSHMRPESKHNPLNIGKTSDRRGGCLLKLPKSSGTCVSSPRSKRVEIIASPAGNSDTFPKDNESSLTNELVVKPSFFNLKSKLNGKRSSLKKPRTHRSIAEMDEQERANPLNVGQYDCVHDSVENLLGRHQFGVTHDSEGSSDKVMPEVEEIIDQLSFRRGRETTRNSVRGSTMTTEEASCSGAENQDLDVDATIESHGKTSLQRSQSSNNFADNVDGPETGAEYVPVNEATIKYTFSRKAAVLTVSKSSKTFASEFCNLPNSLDARSNSLQSTVEHKQCVCKLSDSQVTCRANEVHRIGEGAHMVSEVNSKLVGITYSEGQCATCRTDPPGSLLPSLWDMNHEDHQENSSLISSKMPMAQDGHTVVDRDSSKSPVSATSTISHHTIASSDSKFSDPESCVKPSAVQKRLNLGFPGDMAEPIVEDSISSPFMVSAGKTERINIDRESFKATTVCQKQESVKLIDDQPCCCSWQKNFSFDAAPISQDPQLPKKRSRGSPMLPAQGKQIGYRTNNGPEKMVKPDSSSVSQNSELVAPICESPRGSVSMHSSPDNVHKLTGHDGFSPGPIFSQVQDVQSTSNPVLRLMGKNLMVVNKDEDAFVRLRQLPPGSSNTCASTEYMNLLRFPPGSVPNQGCVSSHFVGPEASLVSSQGLCNPQPHFFNDDLSKSFRNHNSFMAHQKQPMFGNHKKYKYMDMGGVDPSLMWQGLKNRTNSQIQQKKQINRLDSFPCNGERVVAPPHLQHLNHVPAVQMVRNYTQEVIVIDDSPECEAELSRIKAKYTDELNGSQPLPVGVLPPTSSYPSMLPVNAFAFPTSSNPFSRAEPLVGTKHSFPLSQCGGASTSSAKWGGTSRGSGVTLRNPFTSTSSSACHMSQAMYHPTILP